RVPEFALGDDVMLLYLPLAHNFGRLMHLLGAHKGFTIAFCPDPLRVAEAMPAVRPTLLPSIPRLFEKVHTAVLAQFEQVHRPRRRLLGWALGVGRRGGGVGLGARGGGGCGRAAPAGRAGPARAGAAAPPGRPARLLEDQEPP